MDSAFGVDHGDFAKSLKPQHLASLERVAAENSMTPNSTFRRSQYARDKLAVHEVDDEYAAAPKYFKSRMNSLVRTRRSARDSNRSAFFRGDVKKSFSGGVFKPISEMSNMERLGIGGSYRRAKGVNPGDAKWLSDRKNIQLPALHAHIAEHGAGIKKNPLGGAAGTYRIGGKSSGHSIVAGEGPKKQLPYLRAHEGAHADVKRSSYRLHRQIMSNPKKLMREEARADYVAGGHFSLHPDTGSTYAQGGRAMEGLKTKGPKSKFKFDSGSKKTFGDSLPKVTNSQAVGAVKSAIQGQFSHYDLSGKRGDKAINAYRKLHNDMQARGVRGGTNR